MERRSPVVIPSTIQRIRRFMSAEGRFKVKPWAGVDDTLDAFCALLTNRSGNDAFWMELKGLMTALSSDLEKRARFAGRVVDNEVLNIERYDDLLAEIRMVAAKSPKGKGAFVSSLSSLSAPAVSLLLLLGGVMTVGCYEKAGQDDGAQNGDASVSASGSEDTDVDGDSYGDSDSDGDSDIEDEEDLKPTKENDSQQEETTYSQTDTEIEEASDTGIQQETETRSNPDMPTDTEVETDWCDPDEGDGTVTNTLECIVSEVVTDPDEQANIIACIDSLHESWYTGLEELFQNQTDSEIMYDLECLMNTQFSNSLCERPDDAGEYNYEALLDNCLVLLYLGVKFE